MSIATEISRLQTAKSNIKASIESKGVTVPSSAHYDDFPTYINAISQGDEELKDVVYFDYDGTVVAQYTKAEFALLSEHPANPSHTGLTAQGWNISLVDAKTYVAAYGMLNIGQMYVTSDGKTRLYITLQSGYLSPVICFYQTDSQGVSVDWGDGSAEETFIGNGNKSATHTYSAAGNYVIKLTPLSGTFTLGRGTSVQAVVSGTDEDRLTYSKSLKKLEIGASCTGTSAYGLYNCQGLECVSVPSTFVSLATYSFYSCLSLKYITLPTNYTLVNNSNSHFYYNISLKHISIPSGITTLPTYFFQKCYKLDRLAIPSTVTTISTNACTLCMGIKRLVIPNSVTSLGGAFRGIDVDDLIIPGVSSIAQSTFSDATIKRVEIKSGTTSLDASAFAANPSLESIIIPDTVTTLGNSFLTGCTALASVTIPKNVTTIGTYAFNGNGYTKAYYFYPTTPPTLGHVANLVFGGINSDCIIYVPAASVEAYKTTGNWNVASIASHIQAMPE